MLVPKLFTCLKDYSKHQFIKDLISGIIVAIIALPLSIALAIASGVSPEKGLYTAIIGGFIVSLMGGSRVQIGGPTGAFVVIVFGIIQKYGISGLTVATIMAGIILVIMGLCKMGNVIKFIPYPITAGFTSGIAVTIFSTQIKDLFGLYMEKVPSEFVPKWIAYFKAFSTLSWFSLFIGALSILIIILWPKINKKIPGTLIAIIVSTLIVLIFNINIETIGSRYNNLSSTLPTIVIPKFNLSMIKELIMPAITIAVLGGVESLLSAVVADGMIGGKHRSNMELVAEGTANIFSGLFGGIPVTGAIARTAANIKNGGRTPIAGIVHAIALLIIMVIFMPYVKLIPMSALAAILVVVSYNMGEWEAFGRISKAPKSDVAVFLISFALTIFVDLVVAIGVGMILSSFLFMKRMADFTSVKSILDEDDDNKYADILEEISIPKSVSLYEITGPFFFGAADKFANTIREIEERPKVLILKMNHVPVMDATAYRALLSFYNICKKHHTKLIILRLEEQPRNLLSRYGFIELLGESNFCTTVEEAISRANILISNK